MTGIVVEFPDLIEPRPFIWKCIYCGTTAHHVYEDGTIRCASCRVDSGAEWTYIKSESPEAA